MKIHGLFEKWTQNAYNALTWKAICRKEGVHVSKGRNEKVEHDWNGDLAEEFTKLLDRDLHNLVNQVLPEIQGNYCDKMKEGMNSFAAEIKTSSMRVTNHISNPLDNFSHNLERLQVDILREINRKFALAIKKSRIADQTIPPRIRIAMKPAYAQAAAMRGMTLAFALESRVLSGALEYTSLTLPNF
jgi:hypothetical protein